MFTCEADLNMREHLGDDEVKTCQVKVSGRKFGKTVQEVELRASLRTKHCDQQTTVLYSTGSIRLARVRRQGLPKMLTRIFAAERAKHRKVLLDGENFVC